MGHSDEDPAVLSDNIDLNCAKNKVLNFVDMFEVTDWSSVSHHGHELFI